jgi:uncharacterized protein YhbP (UPF0306 family)
MDKAKQILSRIRYANIATVCSDNSPWNTPVFYVYDEDLTLYWWSDSKSKHSRNIYHDGRVVITVYDSSPESDAKGVYIKAQANEVSSGLFEKILSIYNTYAPKEFQLKVENVTGDSPSRLYFAKPEKIWLNGESTSSGQYIDIREKVS